MANLASLIVPLIPSLVDGAKEILTDKKAFKDNLKTKTTISTLATVPASIAGIQVAELETTESFIAYTLSAIFNISLFLWNNRKNSGGA